MADFHKDSPPRSIKRGVPPCIFSLLSALLLLTLTCRAENYRPESDDFVLATLPKKSSESWRDIGALRNTWRKSADPAVAARLASRYLEVYRTEGDPRFIGYAASLLNRWDASEDVPVEILLNLAAVAQLQHHFGDALSILHKLLTRYPGQPQARIMQAAIHQTQGRYENARTACAQLARVADITTASLCLAATHFAAGQIAKATGLLRAIMPRMDPFKTPALWRWSHTLAAESMAALGNWSEAESHYRNALGLDESVRHPPAVYALSSYADYLIERGRHRDVLRLLQDVPRNLSTSLRQAAAKRALGIPDRAETRQLENRMKWMLEQDERAHAREAAYYFLRVQNDGAKALAFARENWRSQREALDALLVLEAATAVCQPESAAPVLAWMDDFAVDHLALINARRRLGEVCL